MNVSCYLIISNNGSVRITKNKPGIDFNEVAVGINLDLPNRLFERPVLVANIAVPDEMFANPSLEAIVDLTAPTVAAALRLKVEDVRDGLQLAMDRAESTTTQPPS